MAGTSVLRQVLSHTLISLALPVQPLPVKARILKDRAPDPRQKMARVFAMCMLGNFLMVLVSKVRVNEQDKRLDKESEDWLFQITDHCNGSLLYFC